jgi:hypothetical protein
MYLADFYEAVEANLFAQPFEAVERDIRLRTLLGCGCCHCCGCSIDYDLRQRGVPDCGGFV